MQNVFAADKALPLWDAFDCGRCCGGKNAKTYRETATTTTIGIVFFFLLLLLLSVYILIVYIFYKHIISFNWKLRGCCCCPESAWLLLLLLPLSLLPFCFGLFCLAFALCFHFVFLRIFCFRFVSFGTAAAVQQHPLAVRESKKGEERQREWETKRTRATPKQQQ